MANQRLTDKSAFSGNLATDDLFHVVDASDTSANPNGTSKKVTNEQIIQTTKVNITSANFSSMDDTGSAGTFFQLLPSSGTGFFYVIIAVNINTLVTSPPSNNTNLFIGYDSSQITDYVIQAFRFNNNVSSRSYNIAPNPRNASGDHLGVISSKPLIVYANQNFNGNISADFYVTYRKCSIV